MADAAAASMMMKAASVEAEAEAEAPSTMRAGSVPRAPAMAEEEALSTMKAASAPLAEAEVDAGTASTMKDASVPLAPAMAEADAPSTMRAGSVPRAPAMAEEEALSTMKAASAPLAEAEVDAGTASTMKDASVPLAPAMAEADAPSTMKAASMPRPEAEAATSTAEATTSTAEASTSAAESSTAERWAILFTVAHVIADQSLPREADFALHFDEVPSPSRISVPRRLCPDPKLYTIRYPSIVAIDSGSGLFVLHATQGIFPATYFLCDASTCKASRLPAVPDSLVFPNAKQRSVGLIASGDNCIVAQLYQPQPQSTRHDSLLYYCSKTGAWEKKSLASSPEHPPWCGHDVISHDKKLWWIDLQYGLLTCDPYVEHPRLRFVALPPGCGTDTGLPADDLEKRRLVASCNGKIRYLEIVCQLEGEDQLPVLLRMWTLTYTEENDHWSVEFCVNLDELCNDGCSSDGFPREIVPKLGLIHPQNPAIVYLFRGDLLVGFDVSTGMLVGCTRYLTDDSAHYFCSSCFVRAWSPLPKAAFQYTRIAIVKRAIFAIAIGFGVVKLTGIPILTIASTAATATTLVPIAKSVTDLAIDLNIGGERMMLLSHRLASVERKLGENEGLIGIVQGLGTTLPPIDRVTKFFRGVGSTAKILKPLAGKNSEVLIIRTKEDADKAVNELCPDTLAGLQLSKDISLDQLVEILNIFREHGRLNLLLKVPGFADRIKEIADSSVINAIAANSHTDDTCSEAEDDWVHVDDNL